MQQNNVEFPWEIRRNGKTCAYTKSVREAEAVIRQLRKIHRNANFKAIYIGGSVSHMPDGGKQDRC